MHVLYLLYVQLFHVCNSIHVDSFVSIVVLIRRTKTAQLCLHSSFVSGTALFRKQFCFRNNFVSRTVLFRKQFCLENSFVLKIVLFREQFCFGNNFVSELVLLRN